MAQRLQMWSTIWVRHSRIRCLSQSPDTPVLALREDNSPGSVSAILVDSSWDELYSADQTIVGSVAGRGIHAQVDKLEVSYS